MIEGLKPYAEYKESGQKWLGQVPRQWASFPLCRVATPKSECGRTDLELLSVYLHRGVIRYADSGGQVHKPSLDLSKYQVVAPGDFVLNNQQAWRGSIGVSKFQGIISPAYVVLKLSPKLNPGYANYLFRSPAMVAQYVAASRGVGDIQRNLFYPDLRNSIALLPPPDEQAAIVRFLDHANRKIDGFIRAKRKLIGLLNEQKQAIIHRAVTRGLHPDVPLKPSGIPWLGDIPKHWEARRLKSFASNVTDQTMTMRDDEPYIALENVESWTGSVKPQHKQGEALFIGQVKIFCSNDVLFGKLRPYLAKVITATTSGVCVGEFFVLRPNESVIIPRFLEQLLRSKKAIDIINRSTFGAKMPRTDWQFVGTLRVALPPVSEQQLITESISLEIRPLNTAIARTEREIALMQEYRTRLTADLVTGKLDVRAAAARLPEEKSDVADTSDESEMSDLSEEPEEPILEEEP